ncbi:MAG: TetR/AcrR family transcriptional regulator [Mycobacterium sp.]|jgi:AcrR family transcriptional regulator
MAALTRRGPGRPPAAKSAETRGRIVRAAREVFSELGYDGGTFQEIAVRADLTRPAINHYFPSKLALYRHVVEDANQIVISAGVDHAQQESTFAGRMQAFIHSGMQSVNRDPTIAAFLVSSVLEFQRNPQFRDDPDNPLTWGREFAARILREAVEAGELPAGTDIDATTEMLIAMLLGLGLYAGYVGSWAQLEVVTEQFLRMVGGGLHTG